MWRGVGNEGICWECGRVCLVDCGLSGVRASLSGAHDRYVTFGLRGLARNVVCGVPAPDTEAYAMHPDEGERAEEWASLIEHPSLFQEGITIMRLRSPATFFAVAIAASAAALTLTFAAPPLGGDIPAAQAQPAPDFQNIDTWLNSQPLKLEELRGK
eukprot:gene10715-14381_t